MIYFIKPVGVAGPVKIGFSLKPDQRLRGLQAGSPLALEIVALMPGTLREEWRVHEDLSDSHSHGEWFRNCRRIEFLIETFAVVPVEGKLTGPRKGWSTRGRRPIPPWRAQRPEEFTRPLREGAPW